MLLKTHLKRILEPNCIGLLWVSAIPLLAIILTFIPLSSNANVELPFLENNHASKVLVFGGFPSCSSACPISLLTLQKTYDEYTDISGEKDLQVIFVNVQLDTAEEITDAYAKSFHQDFTSYSVPTSQANYLYQTLSMKTFTSQQQASAHSGFIYLFSSLNNEWKLKKVFNAEVTKKKLLKQLLKNSA